MTREQAIKKMHEERVAVIKAANNLYTPMDFYNFKSEVEIERRDFIDRLSVLRVLSELCDKNLVRYEKGQYIKNTDENLCEIFGIK